MRSNALVHPEMLGFVQLNNKHTIVDYAAAPCVLAPRATLVIDFVRDERVDLVHRRAEGAQPHLVRTRDIPRVRLLPLQAGIQCLFVNFSAEKGNCTKKGKCTGVVMRMSKHRTSLVNSLVFSAEDIHVSKDHKEQE